MTRGDRRVRRLMAALCLAVAAVSCGSSAKPANRSSGNGQDFTDHPGGNSPAATAVPPTSTTGSNQQGSGR